MCFSSYRCISYGGRNIVRVLARVDPWRLTRHERNPNLMKMEIRDLCRPNVDHIRLEGRSHVRWELARG